MEPFYRPILKKSWFILKKYKLLWPLGLFAAFLGNGGEYGFFFDFTNNLNQQTTVLQNIKNYFFSKELVDFIGLFNNALFVNKLLLLLLVIFCLFFVALIVWLIISSQAGLINGIVETERQAVSRYSVNLKTGSKFFWPVFFINLVAKLISFFVTAVILTPLIVILNAKNSDFFMVTVYASFLIFLPLVVIINFIAKYAIAEAVINGQKTWSAIQKGWNLFIANWLISLEMAFIILIINAVVGILFIIAGMILVSPFLLFSIFNGTIGILTIPMYLVFFLLLFVGTILSVYQTSAWVLLYLKISKEKIYSKLERLTMPSDIPLKKI
jgi:hypothetical protein